MPINGKSAGKRDRKEKIDNPYPSTALTSPLAPSRNERITHHRPAVNKGSNMDTFIATDSEDEEDSFAPVPPRSRQTPTAKLGLPITSDDQLATLSDTHRVSIQQFVEAAKHMEEKLRNKSGGRKPIFTEIQMREMAIRWTTTLDDMRRIPGINIERVKTHGSKLLPLVREYKSNYEAMLDNDDEGDIDPNHQDVIDLVTDDEGGDDDEDEEEDEDFELDEGMEEAILAAEKSPFFTESSSSKGKAPWKPRGGRGGGRGFRRGKAKSYVARKSNGSNSGQSNAGVRKRNSSGGSRRSRGSSHAGSTIARAFGNQGGSSRGGGGGIGMMPT